MPKRVSRNERRSFLKFLAFGAKCAKPFRTTLPFLIVGTEVQAEESLKSGWYKLIEHGGEGKNWIGHYVHPEYKFERSPKPPAKRRVRLRKLTTTQEIKAARGLFVPHNESEKQFLRKSVVLPAGRIDGAAGIRIAKLIPLADAELPEFSGDAKSRLNKRHYSVGVETVALQQWRIGNVAAALETLRKALSYSEPFLEARPVNLRLYDLLAGLLVRSGRPNELSVLIDRMRQREKEAKAVVSGLKTQVHEKLVSGVNHEFAAAWQVIDVEIAKLEERERMATNRLLQIQGRLVIWSSESGTWRDGWRVGVSRKWSGIDI